MSVIITTNAVQIQDLISWEAFRIEQNITSQVDRFFFVYNKFGDRTYTPEVGHVVSVVDDGTTIFGGTIVKIRKRIKGVDILVYEVECKDYTHALDRLLIVKSYTDQTIKQIVDDLVTNHFDSSITGTNVSSQATTTIEKISFDYARASDILTKLAEMIQFDWWVDFDKDLHFVPKGTDGAPFDLADDTGTYEWKTLVLKEDDTQLRNTIYVKGGTYVGNTRTDDKVGEGDAELTLFNLSYIYAEKPVVKKAGVTQTVGIEFTDELGVDGIEVVWNKLGRYIEFDVAPASGNDIEITGDPEIPLLLKLTSPGSVSSKGVYEFKINDKNIKSITDARQRAQAELDAFADTLDEGGFRTKKAGLEAGQSIRIQSTIRGIDDNFIIRRVLTRFRSPGKLFYEINMATIRTFKIIEFLKMLVNQNDDTIGIQEGEDTILNLIISLRDIDKVQVAETLTINANRISLVDAQKSLDTLLRAILNSPPTWVWGGYTPVNDADRKRAPNWSRGATWT